MEWLKEYEGKRGIAYLAVIVASVAPSYCALFILENGRPLASELAANIFACASLGATTGTLLSTYIAMSRAKEKKKISDRDSSVSIAVGFGVSLFIQSGVLSYTMWTDGNFEKYYASCFAITVFYLLLQIPISAAYRALKNTTPPADQG